MPPRPRRMVTYSAAMGALTEVRMILVRLLTGPLQPLSAREELQLLVDRLAILLDRDNGRR